MMKKVIRPFNTVSALFLLIILLLFIQFAFFIADAISSSEKLVKIILFALFYIVIFGWLSAILLCFVFRPKIILHDHHLEIHHWKNGVPYDKAHPFSLPKVTKTIIQYSDLSIFGAFLLKDVIQYIDKNSGFLADYLITAAGARIPIFVKLPKTTTMLRDVLLFAKSEDCLVIDGGLYGYRQVQSLLYELEQRTNIKSVGRVKPKKHGSIFILELIRAFGIICWLTIVPISTIWLEGLFNPNHPPAYQLVWRVLYVISIFLANICLAGYISSFKVKDDAAVKLVGNVFGKFAIVLYAIFFLHLLYRF